MNGQSIHPGIELREKLFKSLSNAFLTSRKGLNRLFKQLDSLIHARALIPLWYKLLFTFGTYTDNEEKIKRRNGLIEETRPLRQSNVLIIVFFSPGMFISFTLNSQQANNFKLNTRKQTTILQQLTNKIQIKSRLIQSKNYSKAKLKTRDIPSLLNSSLVLKQDIWKAGFNSS